jgi:hypothetical protein
MKLMWVKHDFAGFLFILPVLWTRYRHGNRRSSGPPSALKISPGGALARAGELRSMGTGSCAATKYILICFSGYFVGCATGLVYVLWRFERLVVNDLATLCRWQYLRPVRFTARCMFVG